MAERLSRAHGLLESLAACPDDVRLEGVREIATEVAALISDLRTGVRAQLVDGNILPDA